jgi:protein-tyrosine phosphatase
VRRPPPPPPPRQSVVNFPVAPPPGVQHTRVELTDEEGANLLEALPGATAWLEGALRQKGNRVLVHCHAGARGAV